MLLSGRQVWPPQRRIFPRSKSPPPRSRHRTRRPLLSLWLSRGRNSRGMAPTPKYSLNEQGWAMRPACNGLRQLLTVSPLVTFTPPVPPALLSSAVDPMRWKSGALPNAIAAISRASPLFLGIVFWGPVLKSRHWQTHARAAARDMASPNIARGWHRAQSRRCRLEQVNHRVLIDAKLHDRQRQAAISGATVEIATVVITAFTWRRA
jgi:hypothetical protein